MKRMNLEAEEVVRILQAALADHHRVFTTFLTLTLCPAVTLTLTLALLAAWKVQAM